jgi:hypothetical protein
MATTMTTLKSFIAEHKISMSADWADSNPNMSDMPAGSSHWRCILRCGGRRMTVPFSQGPAISREPTVEDVLDCLASDAAGYENALCFEDWAHEYGYDADSRKAEHTFNAVKRSAEKLRQLLDDSDTYNALLFETERQ